MPQGKCIIENSITFIAVINVHPLLINIFLILTLSVSNEILLVFKYPIIIIGSTISLAGNPSKNDKIIFPSIPSNLPNGSSIVDTPLNTLTLLTLIFVINHIIRPDGIDTSIAFAAMEGAFIGGTGDFVTLFELSVRK